MKAIKVTEPGKVVVGFKPKPEVENEEVLIRMKYVGFCGSDLSTYLGKNPMVQYPRIPGHEISAVIEKIGPGVDGDFSIGEKVTVIPYTNCGTCPSCKRDRSYACQYNQTLGVQRDGAMQEFLSVPWKKVLKAPALNELELAMVEPLTVGFHAVSRGRITEKDIVAVMGCGMIGAGAIIGAAIRGSMVIAIDIDDHKLVLSKELGAQYTINSMKQNLHEELMAITGGDGPDVIIEAAGNPVTYRAAIDEVAYTGRVVCIGYAAKEVQFATKLFVQKEMDILGSRNANTDDFREVIAYLEKRTFPMDKMISKKVTPDNVSVAVKEWADSPGKVMKILVTFPG